MRYQVVTDGVVPLTFRSLSTAVSYARELLLTGAAVTIKPIEKEKD